MREVEGMIWQVVSLLVSVAMHVGGAVLLFALVRHCDTEPKAILAEIDLTVVEEPPAPEPEPEPEEEVEQPPEEPDPVEPPPPPPPPPPRAAPPPPPDEPPPPPPPAQETPVAFDNVVLTNEGGDSSWATQQGTGVETDGPIGSPGAQVTERRRTGTPGGEVGGTGPPGPRVVALADLSRQPGPSDGGRLNQILRDNYPREAREQGIEGRARVRLRLMPDGSVRILSVVSATWPGFGPACRSTVERAGRWRPGLDQTGQPVATTVSFDCNFRVNY